MAKPAQKKSKSKLPKVPKFKKAKGYARHRAAALGKRPPVGTKVLIVPRAGPGRPSSYKPEVYNVLLERLTSGESLVSICAEEGMPCITTVGDWRMKYPEFDKAYRKACEIRTHVWGEQVLSIADTPVSFEKVTTSTGGKNGDVETVFTGDSPEHRKLQVDTRLRMMKYHNRADYGDKLETDGKVEHEHTIRVIERVVVKPKPWIEHEG